MSQQITVAFVQQYTDNVLILSQQRGSRLRGSVYEKPFNAGTNVYFERVGATSAVKRTSRHADTPLVDTPHSRRRVSPVPYDWADLIDEPDKVRTLINPENAYAQNAGFAMGRAMDDEIIAALWGTAYTGVDGTTTVALPSGQKVAQDGTPSSLTVDKLLKAKKVLDTNETDPADPRSIVCSAAAIQALLGTTEVKSSDYNTVKALVQGEINTFVGFDFKMSARLPLVTTGTYRAAYAYCKAGMGLAIGTDIKTRITERPDKSYSVQVYVNMDLGATRIEDEKVVEIPCLAGD
jgi:hypothetical protein